MSYAYFYYVEHAHVTGETSAGEPRSETRAIGLFRTQKAAEAAVAQVREAPGFRDTPEGFKISREHIILPEGVTKGRVREVFRACHQYWDEIEQRNIRTEGPLHAIRVGAEVDLVKMRRNPQLSTHPDGFDLGGFQVGQVQWPEGFLPVEE